MSPCLECDVMTRNECDDCGRPVCLECEGTVHMCIAHHDAYTVEDQKDDEDSKEYPVIGGDA